MADGHGRHSSCWLPPAWAWPTTVALGLAGVGISAYLTVVHYSSSVTLACASSGTINCEKVTSSPQSELAGYPVALWGAVYFAIVTAVCLPWAWASPALAARAGRVALAVAGVAMVFRLIYAELFQINAVCLWCSAVHVVTVALFAAVVVATGLSAGNDRTR